MARLRLAGGRSVMACPSRRISPELASSRPAMRRSRVDLPQPEGPRKTQNSRSSMRRSTPLMTRVSPKDLVRDWISRRAMGRAPLLDGAEGQAADELFLRAPAQYQDRRTGEGGNGGQLGPEEAFGAGERGDQGAERRGLGGGQVEGPEGLVPVEDERQERGGGQASAAHWQEHAVDFLGGGGAIHARGFQDVPGDVAEVGVDHPHHDGQVNERQ